MTTGITMSTIMDTRTMTTHEAWRYPLMAWLSPAYPVGGFSYSHGLEWAVESGLVRDRAALQDWVVDVVRHGGGWSDAVCFARGYDAVAAGDLTELREIAELAQALAPTSELALETLAQGAAFRTTTLAAWPHLEDQRSLLDAVAGEDGTGPAYPVAVAIAAALTDIPLAAGLGAYVQAFAAAIVSAGVRLIPLGQTDGQRVTAALAPVVQEVVPLAMRTELDDLATASLMVDWCSMRHEGQYTRLFRS